MVQIVVEHLFKLEGITYSIEKVPKKIHRKINSFRPVHCPSVKLSSIKHVLQKCVIRGAEWSIVLV